MNLESWRDQVAEEEICRHCNGGCYVNNKICEFCGGYGVNTWIGNMMGKPDRPSITDVIREVTKHFRFKLQDKETMLKINNMLEKVFQNTKIIVELESFDRSSWNLKARKRNSIRLLKQRDSIWG
jgi:hypothetical protein